MFSKRFFFSQIIFFAILFALFWLYHGKFGHPLPMLGAVADFKLKNSDGQDVTLGDLKGKVWVADFMFTSCGSICPVMTKHMNILHRAFHPWGDIRLVSFSVNPENDTPQVLQHYAQKYQADTRQWFFLTGSREEITKVAAGSFKLGDIKEPIFHSPYFILVDRRARIRGYYDGTDVKKIREIAKDLTRLAKEKQ